MRHHLFQIIDLVRGESGEEGSQGGSRDSKEGRSEPKRLHKSDDLFESSEDTELSFERILAEEKIKDSMILSSSFTPIGIGHGDLQ